jgi:hypothetical protein
MQAINYNVEVTDMEMKLYSSASLPSQLVWSKDEHMDFDINVSTSRMFTN